MIFIFCFILFIFQDVQARFWKLDYYSYPYETKDGYVFLCVSQVCPPGFEPNKCTILNTGRGCKKCDEGYFSEKDTYRIYKSKYFHLRNSWKSQNCQKRFVYKTKN